jgi:hypothetical protein
MRSLLVSILLIVFFAAAAVAKDTVDTKKFKMVMPYTIVCSVFNVDNAIDVEFKMATAELTLESTVNVDTDAMPTHIEGTLNSVFSMGILIPFYLSGAMDYETYGSNVLGVSKAEIISMEACSNQAVTVIFNGVNMGKMCTNENGMIRLPREEDGVYDLITSSDEVGISLEKQIFIEKQ